MKNTVLSLAFFCAVCACNDQVIAPPPPTGTLTMTANGEDFIRDGFVSKDGWMLNFDHFYVTLANVTAFQVAVASSDKLQPAHPGHEHADLPDGTAHIVRFGQIVVDLAQGEAPIEISSDTKAPIGNYNYVNFDIAQASGDADELVEGVAGFSIVMIGTASKGATDVEFTIKLTETLKFRDCGPTEGAIVTEGGVGTAEVTLHSDHIFGDQETLGEADSVNGEAVGFAPFFAFADTTVTPAQIDLVQATMAETMSGADYEAFLNVLKTIGHTGEAHCELHE